MALGVASLLLAAAPMTLQADLPQKQEQFRECVAERESGGSYTAKNRSSSAMGRYQFLDSKWRNGLAHMVAEKAMEQGWSKEQAMDLRERLRETPIKEWDPWAQDVGFAVALNARGPWSGWRHWILTGSSCTDIVPEWAR